MEDIQQLKEELERWKKQCEEADRKKVEQQLEKIELNDKREELQKELDGLLAKKKNIDGYLKDQEKQFKDELLELKMRRDELNDEVDELQKTMNESQKAFTKIQDNLLVNSLLPQKNLNFKCTLDSERSQTDDEPMNVVYTCHIVSGRPYVLQSGQALLTFEDEQVAKSVTSKKRHFLENEDSRVSVDAQEPVLGKSVKFEVNMNISNKKLKISSLPKDIPEELLKDKVELYFYKSAIGGGEIESVDYDRSNNTACVTYLQNGVVQRVLKKERHRFMAGGAACEVEVMPCVDIELNKLQMFTAVSSRSVLLTGIKSFNDLEEDDIQDIIEVHFQKESNGGGEVVTTLFSQNRKLIPIFEEDLQ